MRHRRTAATSGSTSACARSARASAASRAPDHGGSLRHDAVVERPRPRGAAAMGLQELLPPRIVERLGNMTVIIAVAGALLATFGRRQRAVNRTVREPRVGLAALRAGRTDRQ